MYSYEDLMRAVALYIKLGKCAKATIRQLGYPSKNALKGWCREYEHHLDLRAGFAPQASNSSTAADTDDRGIPSVSAARVKLEHSTTRAKMRNRSMRSK